MGSKNSFINSSHGFRMKDFRLDFGKYKGKLIVNVVKLDPTYILWAYRNVKKFKKIVKNTLLEKQLEKM